MEELERDRLFIALARPQMFAGVTYSFFIINFIVAAELFLLFRSFWVLAVSLMLHGVGVALCLDDPRTIDVWLTRVRHCSRVRNYKLWSCNSYRP